MNKVDIQFTYVADSVIQKLFEATNTCSLCRQSQVPTLSHWHSPDHLNICTKCIANDDVHQIGLKYQGIEFHPLRLLKDLDGVLLNQAYELSFKTPPIKSIGKNHEFYPWARHCGDFAIYHGTVEPEVLSKDVINSLLEEHVCDVSEYWDSNDIINWQGELTFHKFICRHCDEVAYSLDFDI